MVARRIANEGIYKRLEHGNKRLQEIYPQIVRDVNEYRQGRRTMLYQLGWTTLPGLRGLSVSEFRAAPTDDPDNERGVAVGFASEAVRDEFLQAAEAEFAPRRFTNAADAFDSVKAWVVERAARS